MPNTLTIQQIRQRTSRRRLTFGLILLACIGLLRAMYCSDVFADDEHFLDEQSTLVAPHNEPAESTTINKQRQSALAGLLIVGLVSFVGMALVLVVVFWARRLRRLNDAPLPKQHPGDPLWYLRKGTNTSATDNEKHDG